MGNGPLTRTYEPNLALRAVYSRFFDRIHVDETWLSDVRRLASEGTIVYILRSLNFIDVFALDHLTKRYGLPQVRFANDLGLWVLNPLGQGWRNAIHRSNVTQSEALRDALENGGSAALFLKRPPGVLDVAAGASGGRGLKEGDELMRTLIDLQNNGISKPILLVPQVFVWTKRPDTRGTHPIDFLLGPREWPSPARTVGQFLSNYRHVELRAGEPLNLGEYLRAAEPASDEVHVRRIVYAMLRRLERERRSVTGPAEKPPDRIRHELVRSPKVQSAIKRIARTSEETEGQVARRADGMLRKLQAQPDTGTVEALAVLFDRVFHRIYAGIDVDRAGLERVRDASKEGCVVLLPSHKSHIDYLILSYIFNDENIQLPIIAAGDNLSFFPLGTVFRRAGAFFIRRSFKGDPLYSTIVDSYVRRLIRDGFPLELFIEGGRSRTGKLLAPKFGLLHMICEAALSLPQRKVFFVPVSIGYERIVETQSYGRELSGEAKVKEDAAGLLKTTDVLRHRYGRINLQFGSILTLNDIKDDLKLNHDAPLRPPQRRAITTRLGNRVMDEINRVTAVTPGALTALALLSHSRRGLPHEDLVERCERLFTVLQTLGARTTPATATESGALREDSIREAAQMFARGELIEAHAPADVEAASPRGRRASTGAGPGAIYTIADEKRIELNTTKNIIIHFFVERALVSTAMLVAPGPPVERGAVRDRVQWLSRMFKYEFRFRADASFDEIFSDTVETMRRAGELETTELGTLAAGPGHDGWNGGDWLSTYAAMLQSFVESYRIAARGLHALLKGPLPEKELLKRAMATGQRMFFTGEIEQREAVSQPTIRNAFESLVDQGELRLTDERLELVRRDPEALRSIENKIARYLLRAVPT